MFLAGSVKKKCAKIYKSGMQVKKVFSLAIPQVFYV
jgi:hypothetical protein